MRCARDAVAAYAATEPGPDSRPQHRAAAQALADAEEAVAEGMWTPSGPIRAELATAQREVGRLASAAYRQGGLGLGLGALVNADSPSGLPDLAGTLDVLANRQSAILDRMDAVDDETLDRWFEGMLAAENEFHDAV